MIIKKIILDNIRSYKHEEIEFKVGSTLLAGDIGSGKTSVLLGIEFGLFGLQPGQRGSALLRNGETQGGVKLEFEIEGKNILVERTLKKTKTVSQDYAAITIDGKKEELSVTELKQKVLSLLSYPSEFSKKQNVLYKFTVYTPQEEMKQIILEDPDSRINTLRHVFGIDKYKRILENVSVLRLKLREERRLMEGITSTLEEEKSLLSKKELELELDKTKIGELEKDLLEKIKKREIKEQEKKEVSKKIEERNQLKQEVGKSKIMLLSKKENYSSNERLILELTKEIKEFHELGFEISKMQEKEEEISLLKKQKEKISSLMLEANSEIINLKNKLEENKKLRDKMSDLKTCPTCLQDVDPVYRANVLNKAHNEISKSEYRLKELEVEKNNLFEKSKELDLELSFKEKELTDLKILKSKISEVESKKNKLLELNKTNKILEEDINLLEKHIENLNNSIFELSKYEKINEEKELELKSAREDEKLAEIRVAELKKEIEVYSRAIEELKEKIKKVEEIKEKLIYISDLENWLNKKFIPLVSFIEKNVMVSLKKEFSTLFSEWFAILVPETFNVSLDENFSPRIQQKDYEIDYAYLSGGERTAIALAYRLALNQVINSLMSKIKTKEFIILDEPTDGFSEQQLDKMREVLDQLNFKQLLLVSHEQKIESFVENIIRFRKEQGVSFKE
jgi:exonuclease SbcC